MLLSESATSSKTPESALPVTRSGESGKRFWQVLFVLLSLEIGVFLVAAPWSSSWERSLMVGYLSPWRPILLNHYVRGALSGLGLVNLWVGLSQVRSFLRVPAQRSAND